MYTHLMFRHVEGEPHVKGMYGDLLIILVDMC